MVFFPHRRHNEIFESVPQSLIGKSGSSMNERYDVRVMSAREREIYDSFSSTLHSILGERAGTKGIIGSAPSTSLIRTSNDQKLLPNDNYQSAPNSVFLEEIKKDIKKYLLNNETSETRTDDGDELSNKSNMIYASSDLHSLGTNDEAVLNSQNLKIDSSEYNNENNRIGVDSFQTPAEKALTQNVFDLSKVFDPANTQDVQLFGLDDDEEDETDDEETSLELIRTKNHDQANGDAALLRLSRLRTEMERDESGLDAELDVVIGESYGILGSNLKSLRKKKAKLSQGKSNPMEDVWASKDVSNVSNFAELVPEMAIEYPFDLDTFQKRAVYRLERDENVFVAAHTSAGKTVVAEYAIALAMQRKTKVIYTSPIKTLSNQKFRDFATRFGEVGIITGDISINPEANCLVMTTEILRSMLYKGADLIQDLSHVIFDECHWLNDPERGVVWEESIILLPPDVAIVMLSATVPNAMEFAKWVGRTKQKPVYVISTPKRPVPLLHQVFLKGEVFQLFDSSQGRFLDANYRRAMSHHKESTKNSNVRFGGGRNHAWMQLVKYLQKRSLDPAILFCFSKKKCDEAAEQLGTQDLTTAASDRNQIHLFYQSAIQRLSPSDKNVPQIARHREMLKRGIGVHHAGILPIIKEITEVLFQRGLIRILFATETFAMGVNMPARTVVFTAIHKHDSHGYRLLEPGEYIQMAGRAGRRGLDDVGTVLLFPSAADFPTESDVKSVLTGTPKPLRSQFRLTYNMILNLLRIAELRVEDVMARSFSEAPAGRTSSVVKKLLQKGSKTLNSMQGQSIELDRFRELHHLSLRIGNLSSIIGKKIMAEKTNAVTSSMSPGRIVLVRGNDDTFRVAVLLKGLGDGKGKSGLGLSLKATKPLGLKFSSMKKDNPNHIKVLKLLGGPAAQNQKGPYLEDTLSRINLESTNRQFNVGGLIVEIEDILIDNIATVGSQTIRINERGLVPIRGDPDTGAMGDATEQLFQIASDPQHWKVFSSIHPRRDLGLKDFDIEDYWNERQQLVGAMNEEVTELRSNGAISKVKSAFIKLTTESQLEHKLDMLRLATSDESLHLMPEYKQRVEVIQRLGYIDGTSVRLKGRAACEVNTCESLLLTELVFEKALQKLNAVDLAAALSALVFTEKLSSEEAQSRPEQVGEEGSELVEACRSMMQVAHCLGLVQAELGLSVSAHEYAKAHVRLGFVRGVKDWAIGKSFAEVCQAYDGEIPEGSIVRTIVRLCELLRELKNVGRVIGDPNLQTTAETAIQLCRRDVIFAASLYIQ